MPTAERIFLCITSLLLTSLAAGQEREQLARRLLEMSGVRGGLVLHVGCGDGQLTAALHADPRYQVLGLDTRQACVDQARREIQARGLYGPVSVDLLIAPKLPCIDNLVNLIVAERTADIPREELLRVLVPGGIALVQDDRTWNQFAKPWPKSIDQWNHGLHGSDNNPVADDLVVGPPRQLQWMSKPGWSKHHERYPPTIPVLVSANGRVFYFEDETPPCVFNLRTRWSLVARDAFNGTLLWKRPTPDWEPLAWPGELGGGLSGGPVDYRRRLVAAGDRVYVTLGYRDPVSELDAATGETLHEYVGSGGEFTEILWHDERLFLTRKPAGTAGHVTSCRDAASGQLQWERPGGHGIAVDGDHLFFIRGDQIGALDASSGEQLWCVDPEQPATEGSARRTGRGPRFRLQGPLRVGQGVVLACPGSRGAVIALSAEDGRLLWKFQNRGFRPFFRPVTAWIIDGLVWVTDAGEAEGDVADDYLAVGLDPLTGEVLREVPCGAVWNCGHHQRCYPSKATSQFLIFSRRGAEFLNLDDGRVGLNNWTRGACGYGVMPANGLLYAPPHSCRCYSEAALRGLCALAPAERGPMWSSPDPASDRLQKGPAFGEIETADEGSPDPADWPTYRHDGERSGGSPCEIQPQLQARWQVDFGGQITQPVVTRDRVVLAEIDAHTVHALAADSGERQWSFTAGARIDTPPTLHRGSVLFGSADGWVYCLRAEDGELSWRYRAAPHDLRMGRDGQLESVWPVHGAVLVRDDTVYCAAGRGSFVDSGLWMHGLDWATGSPRFGLQLQGPETGAGLTRDNPGRGFVMPGALPDVLVSDGTSVYMRHLACDPQLQDAVDMAPNFYPATVRAGEEFGGDHKYWCDLMEVGPRAFVGKPEWDHRSYFNRFPGQRLYSTTGLLDDSWHIRSYWSYGQIVGQYLVFRGDRGFAVQAYPNAARWASYEAGDGYLLYSGRTRLPEADRPLYALPATEREWQTKLPLRPISLVLAGEKLVVAGPPDSADPVEAAAAIAGRRGGILRILSADEGTTLSEMQLDEPPRFDGIAAAHGRVLIAGQNGGLLCLE